MNNKRSDILRTKALEAVERLNEQSEATIGYASASLTEVPGRHMCIEFDGQVLWDSEGDSLADKPYADDFEDGQPSYRLCALQLVFAAHRTLQAFGDQVFSQAEAVE